MHLSSLISSHSQQGQQATAMVAMAIFPYEQVAAHASGGQTILSRVHHQQQMQCMHSGEGLQGLTRP